MYLLHPIRPPYEGELLQSIIHVFVNLFAAINCGLPDSLGQRVAQSDFLDGAVEFHIHPVLQTYFWVVQHRELGIVLLLTFVSLVKSVHSMTFASQSFDHEYAEIVVHDFKSTKIV